MQLRSLIPMRSIGSIFYPAAEKGYFAWTNMRERYDLLVYVNSSTPTSLR